MYHQQRIGYWSQLAILLALIGGSMIIGAIITGFVIKAMTGVPLTEIANVLKDPRYVDAARVAQGLGAFLTFGVPALVFAAIVDRKPAAGISKCQHRTTSREMGNSIRCEWFA